MKPWAQVRACAAHIAMRRARPASALPGGNAASIARTASDPPPANRRTRPAVSSSQSFARTTTQGLAPVLVAATEMADSAASIISASFFAGMAIVRSNIGEFLQERCAPRARIVEA